MLSGADLARLAERHAQATKGPWRTFDRDKWWTPINSPTVNVIPSIHRKDADLIADLYNSAPSLLLMAKQGLLAGELGEALAQLYEATYHSIDEDKVWLPALDRATKAMEAAGVMPEMDTEEPGVSV